MVDVSFLELGIPLFLELMSISMLIISSIRPLPNTSSESIARAIWLIPGMISAAMIMQMGPKFTGITTLTNSTTIAPNGTGIFNATVIEQNQITIINLPWWWEIHFMIFMILMFYVFWQMINLLTKSD